MAIMRGILHRRDAEGLGPGQEQGERDLLQPADEMAGLFEEAAVVLCHRKPLRARPRRGGSRRVDAQTRTAGILTNIVSILTKLSGRLARQGSAGEMPQHPEAILAGKNRPFTGAEFLDSLRDGREVYIYGEQVKDVTDASGVPQRGALRRAALRRAARQADQGRADRADRHRLRRLYPQILQGGALARRGDRAARRHRRLGAHLLRLDGPQPRLQGRLPQHARRQCRVLRQVRRQCARLAQARAGGGALPQSRAGQSADRPQQAGRTGQGRLHHHPEGDRRRHLRLRRQGRRHQFGADALQFPRPEYGPGDHRSEHGGDVHRADEHAGHQADLPAVLRIRRRRHRLAVGLSADLPLRRERRHLRFRQRVHPLGERAHPSRHRAAEEFLSASPASSTASRCRAARGSRSSSISSPACSTRPRAPPASKASAACRRRSAK